MSGASLLEIANILGHKTMQMVKRYAHCTDTHTAGVVARMAQQYPVTRPRRTAAPRPAPHHRPGARSTTSR
jgi:hypothetical protein